MIRLAALQLRAHNRDDYDMRRDALFERIERATNDCDLLVLPEGTFPAYVLGDDRIDESLVTGVTEELSRIARAAACAIVAGAAVRRGSALYNGAIVVDRDGTLAGSADKLFLWHFDRQWFAPGATIAPVQTTIGRLGVLICADGRIPGIAQALVDRGAELLVMPTAWVTSGRDPQHLENIQADLFGRVRALENGVPFIAANKCGVERAMVAYCGKSQIVNAMGDVIAIASQGEEELVTAQVELEPPAPHRTQRASPESREVTRTATLRVAIACTPLPNDIEKRLRILEADLALAPDGRDGFEQLDRALPAVRLRAKEALDPGFLVPYRLAGYRVAVVDADALPHPWLERVARTRAAELRIYVIVFDSHLRRAYAVDPDGIVIAGTFADFTIASFALDPQRTAQTLVAPGTDVTDGVARAQAISAREPSAT